MSVIVQVRRQKGKHKVDPTAAAMASGDIENGIVALKKVIGRVFTDKIKMHFPQ
ncbi:MAG: hypothetical protein JF619_27065 [Massilia sp.]|nr:hypothetical protein [Massilia sp.]